MPTKSKWPVGAPRSATRGNIPLTMLQDQAELVKDYNSALEGRIVTTLNAELTTLTVSLYIVVPRLRGYNHRLLSFDQDTGSDFPIIAQLHLKAQSTETVKIEDETAFDQLLTAWLSSKQTRSVLDHLVTLSEVVNEY